MFFIIIIIIIVIIILIIILSPTFYVMHAPSVITCIIGGAIQMSAYITFTFTHQASRRAPPIRLYAAKVY